jgi:tetratricopeptide (TPR) repeat protein
MVLFKQRVRRARRYVWRKLGDFRAAADDYGRVVAAGQGTVRLYNNYAFCLAKLGLYDEAVAAYDSALQLDPYNAHALHNRWHAPSKLTLNS